ncbi:MAG: 1-deoxy-D-xylulose-5-phosphate synthase [Nitrospirae bacterium]|nr:1-deoxy-D-xylulose-5-phosphate synthase [Nitrospirota bacterium]
MHLEDIASPSDIKKLSVRELRRLAREIKKTIIERVSLNGGHLASNLGVIDSDDSRVSENIGVFPVSPREMKASTILTEPVIAPHRYRQHSEFWKVGIRTENSLRSSPL